MGDSQFQRETNVENAMLLESIQGGVVYTELEPPYCLKFSTSGMTKLSGYNEKELATMRRADLVHSEDWELLKADVSRQFAKGDICDLNYRLKKKDGSVINVSERAQVIVHDDGKKSVLSIVTGLDQATALERQLHVMEERYQAAIQLSGNVVMEFQLGEKQVAFSENYASVFDDEPPKGNLRELIDKQWVLPEDAGEMEELFANVLVKNEIDAIEFRIQTKSQKSIWASLYLKPVSTENGGLYAVVGCLKNIDEEKKKIAIFSDSLKECNCL